MQSQKGFTLIELMVVVVITGVLSSLDITAYQDYLTRT
ncbi:MULTISPECIES: pilin [unclassified Cocleimonas]|nr:MULTISPECIES: prepilin-type N-terminal cleavage/methylation domain-containing protein [unclassified Cocleimonas]